MIGINLSFHLLMAAFALLAKETMAYFAFSDGRHVVLNPSLLTWDEAVTACSAMNGSLLTVYDAGTLVDIGIDRKWIAWVGLKITPEDDANSARWTSGAAVAWNNWPNPSSFPLGVESCTLAETISPYGWTSVDCDTKWPSLCEVKNGSCRFEASTRSSLVAFNTANLFHIDFDTCKEECENIDTFYCLSFEYNALRRFCQLSNTHRWMHPARFAKFDREWDYYHRQCYTVYVNHTWIPNGEMTLPTEEITTVTTPVITSPETTEAPPQTTRAGYVCVEIESLKPSENETEEIREEVKELKMLGKVYRENRRSKSKESAKDNRPSVRYVGTVALSITISFLLAIVVLDLLTLTRHCKGGKAKVKRKIQLKRRSFSDFSSGKVVSLSWSAPTVSGQHHYACPSDLEDIDVRFQREVGDEEENDDGDEGKNEQEDKNEDGDGGDEVEQPDMEISRLKEEETIYDTAVNSYVSWPYNQSSPVLFPFYRSSSEKTNGFRKSPRNFPKNQSERHPRSKSDSFFNKRIFVMPEAHQNGFTDRPPLTKTEQLVMAYGHHFENEVDANPKSPRELDVEILRKGSHC